MKHAYQVNVKNVHVIVVHAAVVVAELQVKLNKMAAAHTSTAEVYKAHFNQLKRSLIRLESNEDLVDDVLQEAFIRLHLNKSKNIINPKAWIYKVSRNLLIDHYRIEQKKSEHQMVQNDDSKKSHGPEDCLMGIIANLPSKYKKAVYLTDIKGIPQNVSSQNLKISLPTFKSHVQRGRKLVAKGYVECCNYTIDQNGHLSGESKEWSECKVCSKGI